MDYIEKFIKNSWDKIPQEVKDRVLAGEFQLVLGSGDDLKTGDKVEETGKVIFFRRIIEKRFQETVDEMVLSALFQKYGFEENEGHKLVKAFGEKNNGTRQHK